MQADFILKEPPNPIGCPLRGGALIGEGAGVTAPPPRTPLEMIKQKNNF